MILFLPKKSMYLVTLGRAGLTALEPLAAGSHVPYGLFPPRSV